MGTSIDKSEALRLLRGLEDGGMAVDDARILGENLDPVLIHVILRYLRESYPASHPAATAVLDRVVQLTRASPRIVAGSKEGESDPITAWFAKEQTFAAYRGRGAEMIERIVEKLDS